MALEFQRLEVGAGAWVLHVGGRLRHSGAGLRGAEAVGARLECVLLFVLDGLHNFHLFACVCAGAGIFVHSVGLFALQNRVERRHTTLARHTNRFTYHSRSSLGDF